jgi:hypothetical protein
MNAGKTGIVIINLLGGAAVLGSYAWGFSTQPNAAAILWDGVPPDIRPCYTAGMLLAAAGYFLFSYYIIIRLPGGQTRIANRRGYGAFSLLYALILLFSALWMPLTLAAVRSPALLWLVRVDLAIVALGSLALLFALLKVKPRLPRWAHALAVAGCTLFCIQTVLLDAVVWSALFRV